VLLRFVMEKANLKESSPINNLMKTTEKKEVDIEGYILFLEYAIGSRSEGVRPYIVQPNLKIIKIYFVGDDEFLNQRLSPYHRKYCKARGEFFEKSQKLRVSSVEEIPDPYGSY